MQKNALDFNVLYQRPYALTRHPERPAAPAPAWRERRISPKWMGILRFAYWYLHLQAE